MSSNSGFQPSRSNPRLWHRREDRATSFWTEAVGTPPPVYGELWRSIPGRALRRFEPGRSKLSAALTKGEDVELPQPGDRWLYLGAASGTTVSHVADLVGPEGIVYALEKSVRPFSRLIAVAERYPNVFPFLADARRPTDYLGLVPPVDGLYVDVAQPDQVELTWDNSQHYLKSSGLLLLALKTASLGREREPREHLRVASERLEAGFELLRPVNLEPFHRRHFLVGGRPLRALFREEGPRQPAPTTTPTDRHGRSRR